MHQHARHYAPIRSFSCILTARIGDGRMRKYRNDRLLRHSATGVGLCSGRAEKSLIMVPCWEGPHSVMSISLRQCRVMQGKPCETCLLTLNSAQIRMT